MPQIRPGKLSEPAQVHGGALAQAVHQFPTEGRCISSRRRCDCHRRWQTMPDCGNAVGEIGAERILAPEHRTG